MIHIVEVEVQDRDHWGDVIVKDITLPAKIQRVNGIAANAILGANTYMKRLIYAKQHFASSDTIEIENATSVQLGVFSLCVNNAGIINTNTPICVLSEMQNNSYNHNLIKIDGGLLLRGGSLARVVIEEKHISPVVTEASLYTQAAEILAESQDIKDEYPTEQELVDAVLRPAYGNTSKFSNNYIVKIYIDYDK